MIKDKHSAEWMAVKNYCQQQLEEMRETNDGDLDRESTARLRGQIEFAKKILALETEPERPAVNSESYID